MFSELMPIRVNINFVHPFFDIFIDFVPVTPATLFLGILGEKVYLITCSTALTIFKEVQIFIHFTLDNMVYSTSSFVSS